MKVIQRIIKWIKQLFIKDRIYMACDFGTNDRDCYLYYIVKRNGDIEILDFIEKDEGTAVNS